MSIPTSYQKAGAALNETRFALIEGNVEARRVLSTFDTLRKQLDATEGCVQEMRNELLAKDATICELRKTNRQVTKTMRDMQTQRFISARLEIAKKRLQLQRPKKSTKQEQTMKCRPKQEQTVQLQGVSWLPSMDPVIPGVPWMPSAPPLDFADPNGMDDIMDGNVLMNDIFDLY
jgi:hypothetical protein